MERAAARAARAQARRDRAHRERLQTAHDVHDIVGHGLAAISMQAGVALHVLDRSPERARQILSTVQQTSRDALDELRSTWRCSGRPRAGGPPRRGWTNSTRWPSGSPWPGCRSSSSAPAPPVRCRPAWS
jgi:hypothetical protein